MHSDEAVRRVTRSHHFPRVSIDLMAACKGDNSILIEDGNSPEHVVGAEMATNGSLYSSWRYIGSVGPNHAPCNPLSYVPADIPWGTKVAGEGHAAGIVCRFDPRLFNTVTGLGGDWSARYLEACRDLESSEIRVILQEIYLELLSPGFATDILIDTLSNLILIHLARYFRAIPDTPQMGVAELPFSRHDLLTMRRFIEAADGKRISVPDLAAAVGYSISHFHFLFRESTGITPAAFTMAVRLKKAARLLRENVLSIKEIAWRAGFKSQSSFSNAFHKYTGKTPASARSAKYVSIFHLPLAKPVVQEALSATNDTTT